MKKLLTLALMMGTVSIVAPVAAEAKTASVVNADSQIPVPIGQPRYRRVNRGARTRIYTRIVGWGRNRYRETVRVTYLPNGRTQTRVISRTRLRW